VSAAQGRRRHGVVKFFNIERGYGFIVPDDGGRDVFVHITAVHQAGIASLEAGMHICFEVEEAPDGRGWQATRLQLMDPLPGQSSPEDEP